MFHFPQSLATTNNTGHTAFIEKFLERNDRTFIGNKSEVEKLFSW